MLTSLQENFTNFYELLNIRYDVESSFTNIPIKETIDNIIDEIYNKQKLKPMCSKLIFKRLLMKLTTEALSN